MGGTTSLFKQGFTISDYGVIEKGLKYAQTACCVAM